VKVKRGQEQSDIVLQILRAVVILRSGTDLCSIQVNLPSPFPAEVSSDPLYLNFEVTANRGKAYMKEHLKVDAEVIDSRSKLTRLSYKPKEK